MNTSEFDEIINKTVLEFYEKNEYFTKVNLKSTSLFPLISTSENQVQFDFLIFCLEIFANYNDYNDNSERSRISYKKSVVTEAYIRYLFKSIKLVNGINVVSLLSLFNKFSQQKKLAYFTNNIWTLKLLVGNIEDNYEGSKGDGSLPLVSKELLLLKSNILAFNNYPSNAMVSLLNKMLEIKNNKNNEFNLSLYLNQDDDVGIYLNEYFSQIEIAKKYPLLNELTKEKNNSTPTAQWLKNIKTSIEAFGENEYFVFAFEFINQSIKFLSNQISNLNKIDIQNASLNDVNISNTNESLLRTIIWSLKNYKIESQLKNIEELALLSYKKLPFLGTIQPRLGNALLFLIYCQEFNVATPILNHIQSKIKYAVALKLIDKYIAELAQKSGKTIDQMEDENVPHFDLDSLRSKEFTYGNITAKVQIMTYNTVSLEWSVDQKSQKSVPAQMKTEYPTELKALQKQVKEIKETLSAQTKRVETFYLAERNWNFEDWTPVFHEHGLMSAISRPLIWEFNLDDKKIPLMHIDGVWKDENDHVIDFSGQNSSLSLWHPIHASADSVMKWRQILQKYKIAQPIKQAYREVYIITEAEANTRSYSNRFAAHILKNYQFGALCKLRNWKGFNQFHGGRTPELTIKNHKIKVQYYVDFAHYDNSGQYLTTDQVRFYKNNEQMDLVDVPKILFSEALRDVDMFVGVCSIGNDAAWRDGGHQFGQDYWQSYSFGDLSEVAKTRKEILTGILSKLKVAKVSHIDGNFLVVKGKIRTYKIHLGSTNILMEPNNQYLCIVQDRSSSAGAKLFIPFEGDEGLSIIISKALLLAEDDKISDSSMVSQIKIR